MRRKNQRGLTLIELIIAFTLLTMLTAMSVPMARYRVRREKERDLRNALHELHTAIDKYKDACDAGQLGPPVLGTECYPKTLEELVEGVKKANEVDKKIKFLRRIPLDPFTNTREWGKRSVQDDPTSTNWGGQNVFDVFTKSMEKAPDGKPYSDW